MVAQVTTTLVTYHLGDPTQTDSVAHYLYGLGTRPLAQNTTAWEYLLPDALGSVRQIADASGNVTLAESYEPYGSVLTTNGTASSIFGYSGEQIDATGLIYLRARYLQPTLGMFTSRDPWSGDEMRPGSMNGFNYVEGNPINATDASGMLRPYFVTAYIQNSNVYGGLALRDMPSQNATVRKRVADGTSVRVWVGPKNEGNTSFAYVQDPVNVWGWAVAWQNGIQYLTNISPPPSPRPGPAPSPDGKWVSPFGIRVGYLKGYSWTGTGSNDHNGIDLVSPNDPFAISGQVNYGTAGIWYDSGVECPRYENYSNDDDGRKVVAVISGRIGDVSPKGTFRDSSIINLLSDDGNYQVQYVHMNAAPTLVKGQQVNAGDLLGWYGPYGDWNGIMHLHLGLKVGGTWSDPEPYLP